MKSPESAKNFIEKSDSMINQIKTRQTEELIFAFCGALGSGTSKVATEVEKIIHSYGYEVKKIKVSNLIIEHIDYVKESLKDNPLLKEIDFEHGLQGLNNYQRITVLQLAGNALREKMSNEILAQLAIQEIAINREIQEKNGMPVPKKESRRVVTIIDSLKHPDEVNLLRMVYNNMFYLFGILCPENIRINRLKKLKKIDPIKIPELMERDKSEDLDYGQQLLDTIFHSDFFVRNTRDTTSSFIPNLERFIKIILGEAPITPTHEESAMYYARSAAVRSGCLSRQVGASIVSEDGELISTGCNDVPKFGGGLYSAKNGPNDARCMNINSKYCVNQEFKKTIFKDIDKILKEEIKDINLQSKISTRIRSHDRLKGLIEYCRAIHAEMDAITSAARLGRLPLKGASMFCTTFPCHNCARHIIASGLRNVYYIEPFEKSLALDLHDDAIAFDPENSETQSKVIFLPFEGVAPRRYLSLFQANERKKDGKKMEVELTTSKPIIIQLLDTYIDYESKVVKNLEMMKSEFVS